MTFPQSAGPVDRTTAVRMLAAVTGLGLALRLVRLGSDLWLDEIAALLMYGDLGSLEILTSYPRPNNHPLNTILVNASTGLFGPNEWAARLPAALFGAATVPALYVAGRSAVDRATALGAALLLAVSYHHVFYSQNARGYAAYLLFSVLAAGLLPTVLEGGRRTGALYAGSLVLAIAAIPLAAAVLVAHGIVAAVVLAVRRLSGRGPGGAAIPTAVALAVPAAAALILYAPLLRRMVSALERSYREERIGFTFGSPELLGEVAKHLAAGLGAGWLAVALPVVLVAGAGAVRAAGRGPIVVGCLALPPLLTAAGLALADASFYPRFFLLLLPLGMLVTAEGLRWLAQIAEAIRPGVGSPAFVAALGATALLFLVSLVPYYRVPKQSYRSAAAYLADRCGDRSLIVDVATSGFRFYGPRYGLEPGDGLVLIRSPERLAAELADPGRDDPCLVTTFPDALEDRFPDLLPELRAGWRLAARFPATVSGGEISIWRRGGAA